MKLIRTFKLAGAVQFEVSSPSHGDPFSVFVDWRHWPVIRQYRWYPIVQTVRGREIGKVVADIPTAVGQRRKVSLSRLVWELEHGPLDPPTRRVFTRNGDWWDLMASNLRLSKGRPAAHLGRRFP